MKYLQVLEHGMSAWLEVPVYPHRFASREFRFLAAEIGHVHTAELWISHFHGQFTTLLLEDGLAEEHRWVPNSGWITFHIRHDEDFKHAL
jgi:luciferase-like monooxygenase